MSEAQAKGPTPGPWGWFGNTDNHEIYLATPDRGMQFVMRFARFGMNKGQPTFQVDGRMVEAKHLVKFDVGDGKATGVEAGKADPGVYRMDVTGIDHPDARLIAASPDLLEACQAARRAFAELNGNVSREVWERLYEVTQTLDAAIAKATGQTPA